MARQAVQLDLLPRIKVMQTSAQEQGQIYVPIVNWTVFVAVVLFVVGFGSSDALSGAYGAAGGSPLFRQDRAESYEQKMTNWESFAAGLKARLAYFPAFQE